MSTPKIPQRCTRWRSSKVVLSTVGPYQLCGSMLVKACVVTGTGYVDLCGDPGWMPAMIDAHEMQRRHRVPGLSSRAASAQSLPIAVSSACKLCVSTAWRIQRRALGGGVVAMRGGFMGSTAASLKTTLAAAANPSLLKSLRSSLALTPGFEGSQQPRMSLPYFFEPIGAWVTPFVMAPINTKNVHRTNQLLGHRYGADFCSDEMMIVPGLGEIGRGAAEAVAKVNPLASDALHPATARAARSVRRVITSRCSSPRTRARHALH